MPEISWSAIGQNRKLCVPYSLREIPQLSEPPATIDISYCNWLKTEVSEN